ncbi:MAG TPA: TonB-dependent receptor, partial [Flavobacteriales bacterium]|nr:TonB-dependent receptor [Flavobacteriales bacterium]
MFTKNDVNEDGFMDMPLNQTFIGMNRWKYVGVKGLMSQFGVKHINIVNLGGQTAHNFDQENRDTLTWGTEMITQRTEAFGKIGYVFPERKYNSVGLQLFGVNHVQRSYYGLRQYNGDEKSFYSNFIYQTILGNTNHKLKLGLSYLYDDVKENLDTSRFDRIEQVPGAFAEYTLILNEKMTLVTGFRADYHNLYKWIYSPRLHFRYGIAEKTVLRASGGMGTRIASIIAENSGYLASSRRFVYPGTNNAYGLEPEVAVNAGLTLSQGFKLNYREGSIVIDFFRTEFLDQVVVDLDKSSQEVNFYNLSTSMGQSFANSFQIEFSYEIVKRFDVKMAYRYYDVKTDFSKGLLRKSLLAKDRGFVNLAYETRKNKKMGNWKFDATTQLIGPQRLPYTASNPLQYQLREYTPFYVLQSAQITRVFSKMFELYLGGENLTNY